MLVPVGGRIEPDCEANLRALEVAGYTVRRVYGYSAIDQGRNQMATDALAAGFEELMWVDSDVVFDPGDVERLRRHDLPICCGLYAKKGARTFACNFPQGVRSVKFGARGGMVEVDGVGFGFTHTRREVYERVAAVDKLPVCNTKFKERMVPYFQPSVVPDGVGGFLYLAEDLAFCERARRAGVKIFADTTIRLWHVGSYRYGWEDAGREVQRFGDYTFEIQ